MAVQASYYVDLVFCIDCTGSMSPVLSEVKANALALLPALEKRMQEKSKHIDRLRIRVIGFRDYYVDTTPMVEMREFVDLRTQGSDFESFVKDLSADGGGDEPENGLEALALAIKSSWNPDQSKGRRVIVVWTDASAHPLEKAATKPGHYPAGLPKNMDELTELWESLKPTSRRLLLYAPDSPPWSMIGASWGQTIHFPSVAGQGLAEIEFDAILDSIAGSV